MRSSPALFNQLRHKTGPTRLVTRANAGTIVAVKILVKLDKVAPVWIALKFFQTPVNGPSTGCISKENSDEAT
jgi:hypothetical protein